MKIRIEFKTVLLCAVLSLSACMASAQAKDWAKLSRYAADNEKVATSGNSGKRVVLIGNSITDIWVSMRPQFFAGNDLVGRGISGQTSHQLLSRFQQDVVGLSPMAVVINIGTNDVAENIGLYSEDGTFGNIVSLVQLAQANGIRPILATVLPAAGFRWNDAVTDAPEKIMSLNKRIRAYAAEHKIPLIDYYPAMQAADGRALNPAYTKDGVHPTEAGYEVMEAVALPVIRSVRQ